MAKITEGKVKELIEVISKGLVGGVGEPYPGEMCVMHAISVVMEGVEYEDNPTCVHDTIVAFDIALNDQPWSSTKARANGMLKEAVAKLGSTHVNGDKWIQDVFIAATSKHLTSFLKEQSNTASKYMSLVERVFCKYVIDQLETGKLQLFTNTWYQIKNDINDYGLSCLEEDIFAGTDVGDEPEYVVENIFHITGKKKNNTNLRWLANIAADVCIKHKTKGSKFLYLLD